MSLKSLAAAVCIYEEAIRLEELTHHPHLADYEREAVEAAWKTLMACLHAGNEIDRLEGAA